MAIRIVRLRTTRHRKGKLRIGAVRHAPRGVLKKNYARHNYFDVPLAELAPNAPLVSWFFSEPLTVERWIDYVTLAPVRAFAEQGRDDPCYITVCADYGARGLSPPFRMNGFRRDTLN